MDKDIRNKESALEKLKLDNEIEDQKVSMAQKKAYERSMKDQYGSNWKKILGIGKGLARGLQPNMEVVHDLYTADAGDLRELTRPERR